MGTAQKVRSVATVVMGIALAAGLTACGAGAEPAPGARTSGGDSGQSPETGTGQNGTDDAQPGGDASEDLYSGGITIDTNYGSEILPTYQKQGVLCLPAWVDHPDGTPLSGQYIEVLPDSPDEGAAACANIWEGSDALSQSLPEIDPAAVPDGPSFEILAAAIVARIDSAFRNPLIGAPSFETAYDAWVGQGTADISVYGEAGRTLVVITPTGDGPGVIYAVLCDGRC